MIFVLVAAKHKLEHYRSKVHMGLIDSCIRVTIDCIETENDKWLFILPTRHWENKLRGVRIDRIYLCRNTVDYTDDVKRSIIPALSCGEKGVVIF